MSNQDCEIVRQRPVGSGSGSRQWSVALCWTAQRLSGLARDVIAKKPTGGLYGAGLNGGAVSALVLVALVCGSSLADAVERTGGARIRRELEVTPGVWISPAELARLPMRGPAWERLKAHADAPAGVPDLSDQNQMNNVYVLAKALVYARTKQEKYRAEVIDQCMMAIDTERGGRTLALGRELAAYVIAADLVALPPEKDEIFRA